MKTSEKHPYLIQLGLLIRKKRSALGLTQEALALEADIDRSYIGGVERGERNVSFLTLVRIARCLSCDIPALTRGIPNE